MSTINFFGKERTVLYVDPTVGPGDGSGVESPLNGISGGYSNAVFVMRRSETPVEIASNLNFGNDVFFLGLPYFTAISGVSCYTLNEKVAPAISGISGITSEAHNFGLETHLKEVIPPEVFETWNDDALYANITLKDNSNITISNTQDISSGVAFGMNRIKMSTETTTLSAGISGSSSITFSSNQGSGFVSNCFFVDNIDTAVDVDEFENPTYYSQGIDIEGPGLRFYFDSINDFHFTNNKFSVHKDISLSEGYINVGNSDSFNFNNNQVWLSSNNESSRSRFLYSLATNENINILNNDVAMQKYGNQEYIGHAFDVLSPSSIIKNNTITFKGGADGTLEALVYVYNTDDYPGYFVFQNNTFVDNIGVNRVIQGDVIHLENTSSIQQGESIVSDISASFVPSVSANDGSNLMHIDLPGQNCDNLTVSCDSDITRAFDVENASYMRGLTIEGQSRINNTSFAEIDTFTFDHSFTPYVFVVSNSFVRVKNVTLKDTWDTSGVAWLQTSGSNSRTVIDAINETVKAKTFNDADHPYGIWAANYDSTVGTWYGDNADYYAQSWSTKRNPNNASIRFKSRSEGRPLWVAPPTLGGVKKTPSGGKQKVRVYVAFKNFTYMETYTSKFEIHVETGDGTIFNSVSHGVWQDDIDSVWNEVGLTKKYCDVYFDTVSVSNLDIRFSYDWVDNSGVFYLDPIVEILSV